MGYLKLKLIYPTVSKTLDIDRYNRIFIEILDTQIFGTQIWIIIIFDAN